MVKNRFISACVFSVVAVMTPVIASAQSYGYDRYYERHYDRQHGRHYHQDERLYEYHPAPVWRNQYVLPPAVYVNPVPVYVPRPVYVPAPPVYYNPYYGNGYYRPGYGSRVDYGYSSNRDIAGMAMGGLIGGAIGQEIGGRDGRAAGAIIGAIIGSQ